MKSAAQRQKTRGSLLGVILALGVLTIGAYALLMLSNSLVIFAGGKTHSDRKADHAGESVIHMALQRFKEGDFEFRESLRYDFEGNLAEATLTFDSSSGEPYSTNNLGNSVAVTGWNTTLVPPNSAHLVAIASQGRSKRVIEMIVVNDSFPWSIASNGSITGNDMEVYSIISTTRLNGAANSPIAEKQKHKSHILSNSPGGGSLGSSASIYLTGNSVVTGKAQAVGDVVAISPSQVERELSNQSPQAITLAATASDFTPGPTQTTVYGSQPEISGLFEATSTGSPVVVGDVHFNDGLLYIKGGDVELRGNITGNGAVVAEGNILVTGSMQTTSDLAALVADGDITINGQGANTSSFNGLILAKGSFSAKDTRLIGSIITLDDTGSVTLERVQSVSAKNLTKIDLNVAVELEKAAKTNGASPGSGISSLEPIGVRYTDNNGNDHFVIFDPENYAALEALGVVIRDSAAQGGAESGEVVIRNADGSFSTTPTPTIQGSFTIAEGAWSTYEGEVKTDTVTYKEVFQLDFNEFLKDRGTFRRVYWNSKPYNE